MNNLLKRYKSLCGPIHFEIFTFFSLWTNRKRKTKFCICICKKCIHIYIYIYIYTHIFTHAAPLLKQDMTQGQFLSGVYLV